ncbi:MAG: class I SAM-dependent methyltransferase [Candidatus Omnitrophica bacterium]|nr:class I SAM-dependent methyltransferase [Candidatus Omnitrophota bacterium]
MVNHFGKCWKSYLDKHFSQERVEEARQSILQFLNRSDLKGLSMTDLGCGSGLFSYAAYSAGASPVYSLDYDSMAVECARSLWEREGKPGNWHVRQASILENPQTLNSPQTDLVYAWGTLQHTGDMWKAFRNSAALVRPGGLFYVAVYNKVPGIGLKSSRFWSVIKQGYSRSPFFLQEIFFWVFNFLFSLANLVRFRKSVSKRRRGMDRHIDLRAWLGAWPCEFTEAEKVIEFCQKELGFQLIRTNLTEKLANNEFLFQKASL